MTTGEIKGAPARSESGRRASRHMAHTAIANLALPLASFATAPLMARALGASGRGELAAVTSPFLLITVIGMLGIPEAITYLVAKNSAVVRRATFTGGALLLLSGVALTCLLIAVAPLLAGDDAVIAREMSIVALAVPPTLLVGVLRGTASGLNEWSRVNAEKYASGLGRLGLTLALAMAGHLTVETAAAVLVGTPLLGALAYVRLRRAASPATPEPTLKPLTAYASRVWAGAASGIVLNKLDQVLMVSLSGPLQLGMYAAASSVADAALLANNAVRDVSFAEQSRSVAAHRLTASARRSFLVSLLVAAFIAATCPWWIPLLFGPSFAGAVPMAIILCAASALGVPGSVAGAGLSAVGRPGLRSSALCVAALVNAAALFVLAPPLGGVGAALATLGGNLIAANLNIVFARPLLQVGFAEFYTIGRSDVAALWRLFRDLLPAGRA